MVNEYISKYKNMSVHDWMWNHQRNLHFKMKYHGLNMQKIPSDLFIYSEIIFEVKPDVIIEIGAAGGGTALWFCHQLDNIGKGKLISLDINHGGFHAEHERITKVTGDSTSEETAEKVRKLIKKTDKVLVIHDGSHKKCDIKKDFLNYGHLVTKGSFFIVEDGSMDIFGWKDHRTNGHDCGLIAALEIAAENDNFVIDNEKERYIVTNNPCGYLRKTK